MILVPPPPLSSFPLTPNPNHPLRHRIRQLPATSRYRRSPNLALPAATSSGVDAFTKNSGYLFELSNSEADSLTEYNISKIGSIYRNKPLVVLRRLFQIGTSLGKWVLLRYLDSIIERSEEMFKVQIVELFIYFINIYVYVNNFTYAYICLMCNIIKIYMM